MKAILILLTLFWWQLDMAQQLSLRNIHKSWKHSKLQVPGEDDMCSDCIDFGFDFIDPLSNVTTDPTSSKNCSGICQALEARSKSKAAGKVCTDLCAKVGITEFLFAVNTSHYDPLYFCSLLLSCFGNGNCDASIAVFNVTPIVVPQGGDFNVNMVFKTVNGTGIGQIKMNFTTVDGVPMNRVYLVDPQVPGTHVFIWDGKAIVDANCDKNCEQWLPGTYSISVDAESCDGVCGENNKVCSKSSASFSVVAKNV